MTRARRDRIALRAARQEIVDAANKARVDRGITPFSMRTIQQAVCVARRRQLVSGDVFKQAGFRDVER